MGSWNQTCGLSNLHIGPGQSVYVFVLEQNPRYDHSYSTNLFTPVVLPFEAEYDAYGSGINCAGPGLEPVIQGLKQYLVEVEQGPNPYHDIAVTRDTFTVNRLFEAANEDRLFVNTRSTQEPHRVYVTMFRKDIVDDILENRVVEEYVGNGQGDHGWGNNFVKLRFADIVADVHPLIEAIIADPEAAQASYATADVVDSIHRHRDQWLAARWLDSVGIRFSRIVNINRVISQALQTPNQKTLDWLEQVVAQFLKGVYIDTFMHAARKSWIPGGHEGSQSLSGGALRLLAAVTVRALDREKAEWLADNPDDADEYIEE